MLSFTIQSAKALVMMKLISHNIKVIFSTIANNLYDIVKFPKLKLSCQIILTESENKHNIITS